MLCPRCGYYSETEDNVCPECGEILSSGAAETPGGAEAIRQGKRARQAIREAGQQSLEARRRRRSGASHATVEMPAVRDDREEEDYSAYTVSESEAAEEDGSPVMERRRRSVYAEDTAQEEQQEKAYKEWIAKGGHQRLRMVNWVKITLILTVLAAFAAAGVWLFLEKTDPGQKLLARMGREANSSALWAVGEELMNTGDMEGAIRIFEKAKQQDEGQNTPVVDPDGLLMLAGAYEAADRTQDAAALYEKIYTDTPSRTEAYVNHIRILMSSGKYGDLAKAGELMKTAYEKTGEASFQTQRTDLLPEAPKVDLTAGYYEAKKNIRIWSRQGYDVYYILNDDEAVLPEGGHLWTDRVPLDEGTWNLRAVATNGELISDELKATYKIIMPSPRMPQCNLAPGPYKTRQKVRLRPGKENEKDDDIVIYYTVDGSTPNADSPIYKENEQIQLPSGHKVTIKALAVNRYNKVSQVMEVSYKIEAKPYPLTAWDIKETISGLDLNRTTMQDFISAYGEGKQVETEQNPDFTSECRKYEYPWGYAVMNMANRNWVLVELYFRDNSTFKAPRGTGIGDTVDFVTGKFRDMGQVESASGNRGLYALDSGSDGKIWKQEEKTGQKIVRYRIKTEGHYYVLDYYISQNNTVSAVHWWYKP